MHSALEQKLIQYVDANVERLTALVAGLVQHPSENTPPTGAEGACQDYIASVLSAAGWTPETYDLDSVPGLHEHPVFESGRDYSGRPNLGARRNGAGNGRSLILSGHIDTVPRGTQPWTRDPFGGQVEGNLLYGRGSNDMKGGVALSLFAAEALANLDIRLAGDLVFETVVDEEFGGVNGTLAGRLRGYVADAAVVTEPSFLRICAAQRGGRTAHITFTSKGGILNYDGAATGVVDQLTHFLAELRKFAAQRRRTAPPHPLYTGVADPVPVSVTKIFTGPWGTGEPITTPDDCKLELYWELMPGETQAGVEREFFAWFDSMLASAPSTFPARPLVEFPIRWLPGSAILASDPLVTALSGCAISVLGQAPPVVGIEGPCDMFVFHQFGIPAVLWGPRGGNTHAADEYVELDTVVAAAKVLLLLICRWCGVAS